MEQVGIGAGVKAGWKEVASTCSRTHRTPRHPSPIPPHSPLSPQVTARVPGGRGGRGANALVVILHLQTDGPAQPPGDVQQPLHDELIFFLPQSNWCGESSRKVLQKPASRCGTTDRILAGSWLGSRELYSHPSSQALSALNHPEGGLAGQHTSCLEIQVHMCKL